MVGYKELMELVKKTQATPGNILDVSDAAICDMQDMIGHSTVQELRELSNNDQYKPTFYRIYGYAYGTVEAIRFFTKNSDKLDQIIRERDEAICDRDDLTDDLNKVNEKVKSIELENRELTRKLETTNAIIDSQAQEIIQLKARLYDLMNK